MIEDDRPTIDVALLAGFGFRCRPDCGLCCYASPRVSPLERTAILRVIPNATIVGSGPDRFLASRPDGGSCQFLSGHRCGIHEIRPAPCREFPITVHLGERLQATVVLSCPGLSLEPLRARRTEASAGGAIGLAAELASAERRVDEGVIGRIAAAQRRRRKIVRLLDQEDRWQPEVEVRRVLRDRLPWPRLDDFPVDDPPEAEDGRDRLPLFFDARPGPVALAKGLGGWELSELAPTGGMASSLGVLPPPDRPPSTDLPGSALLTGYLRYWLERDVLFGAVLLEMVEDQEGDVLSRVTDTLCAIGACVLARAEVRAKLTRASRDPLTALEVADGIRASDQDWLDRPTWGELL